MTSFEEDKARVRVTSTQQEQLVQLRRPIIPILVLGYSGSGKTTFIDAACTEHDHSGHAEKPATLNVAIRQATIYKHSYDLIDTPGFDNPDLSNYEAFARIVD
ncbi:hypothetical protein BDV93DRAFT_529525 [Ceratobasidium sp. AG-I]|nr:hypothetical protein BDV93DRAFT_529525 [Ceratobasidium sp. AG-I]